MEGGGVGTDTRNGILCPRGKQSRLPPSVETRQRGAGSVEPKRGTGSPGGRAPVRMDDIGLEKGGIANAELKRTVQPVAELC